MIERIEVDSETLDDALEARMVSRTALKLFKKARESIATTREQRTIPFTESIPVKIVVPWVIYDLCKSVGAVLRIGVGKASNSEATVSQQIR